MGVTCTTCRQLRHPYLEGSCSFDIAKVVEAGFRNVGGAVGEALSGTQTAKLADLARHLGTVTVRIVFDRDEAGQSGTLKAAGLIEQAGLKMRPTGFFDWAIMLDLFALPKSYKTPKCSNIEITR